MNTRILSLYRSTRAGPVHLDATEGVPGRRYRQLWIDAQDIDGHALKAVTCIADGLEVAGQPSLRYLALLRYGARAHGLPQRWLRLLDGIEQAQ